MNLRTNLFLIAAAAAGQSMATAKILRDQDSAVRGFRAALASIQTKAGMGWRDVQFECGAWTITMMQGRTEHTATCGIRTSVALCQTNRDEINQVLHDAGYEYDSVNDLNCWTIEVQTGVPA